MSNAMGRRPASARGSALEQSAGTRYFNEQKWHTFGLPATLYCTAAAALPLGRAADSQGLFDQSRAQPSVTQPPQPFSANHKPLMISQRRRTRLAGFTLLVTSCLRSRRSARPATLEGLRSSINAFAQAVPQRRTPERKHKRKRPLLSLIDHH